MEVAAQMNAQRVTLSAQQAAEADGVDPRFAEIVRASVFVEHSVERVSEGSVADWNCVV